MKGTGKDSILEESIFTSKDKYRHLTFIVPSVKTPLLT